jgi:lysophospholipid acyltransferase (LPLAT)-like uncharacterized protein
MKLRNPILIRLAAAAASWVLRAWLGTLRREEHAEDPRTDVFRKGWNENAFFLAWHETVLITTWRFGSRHWSVLISKSADGELIAGTARSLGWRTVRGSASRGAVGGLKGMLAPDPRTGKIQAAFTADGPRGPRRKLKPGILLAAARTGAPILPSGVATSGDKRARSWDRMLLPRLFGRYAIELGPPIHLPPDLDEAAIATWTMRVEAEMERLTAKAERRLRGEPVAGDSIDRREETKESEVAKAA